MAIQPDREQERLYSASEVARLLKNKDATLDDYILKTYYTIMDDKEISNEQKIRLNNVIFNNFKQIKLQLETTVLLPRIFEKSLEIVAGIKHVSLVLNFELTLPKKPAVIQYFDPQNGLQSLMIHCIDNDSNFLDLLRDNNLHTRMVSYCGAHYELNFPVPFPELPVRDTFEEGLFETVYDYFPLNPIECLQRFGNYVSRLPLPQPILDVYKPLYQRWLLRRTIVDIEYFQTVLINYDTLSMHLEEHTMLPKSIAMFFYHRSSRFILSFALEIYEMVHGCECREAIVFYSRLVRLMEIYEILKDNLQVSPRTDQFLNDIEDKTEVLEFIGLTYDRIYMLTEQIYSLYESFNTFTWVLLYEYPLNLHDIHLSYHSVNKIDGCIDDCWNQLQLEHGRIETICTVHAQQITSVRTISEIWCRVFRICQINSLQIERIKNIVCYILSISATNYQSYYRQFKGNTTKMVFSFNKIVTDEIVSNTRGFLGDHLRLLGQKIVDDNRINNVVD